MPVFSDTEHLYKVMGALFERVRQEPEITSNLVKGDMIVQFIYKNPDGVITVDLRKEPIQFFFGQCDLKPDVEMKQSADTAHRFWLGKLNVPQAIATRKVVSRGSIPKALSLLPAVKQAFPLYPQVLREIGEEALIPVEKTRRSRRKKRWLPDLFSGGKRLSEADYAALSAHLIPLVEGESEETPGLKVQELPANENALKVEMLRRMVLIRCFEERMATEFEEGTVPAEALHLSIGQEACAVGACFALQEGDYMTTTHRGHGHMLAMGTALEGMTAELYGKSTGLCSGFGGCMHVTDAELGALGANGIIGAPSLIAAGGAFSARMRGTSQVALAFMGDGSTAHGMFHEALNFAAVFDLPAIMFVENNQYAEFTSAKDHTRLERISERSKGYGASGVTVDGNDVWEVYQKVQEAAARARRGEGPTLIEGITYRWCGHTEGETVVYRTEEEVAEWKTRDPIERWRNNLVEAGIITKNEVAQIEQEAQAAVEKAVAFANESPEPDLKSISENVFAPEPASLYGDQPKLQSEREIGVSAALREALTEEMARDERTYLIGEDVTTGGYFAITAELVERFTTKRVIDTPISEYVIVGSCVGAAMTGMRPIAEIQFSDFITCCMDPLVNQAAKLRYMSGGQYRLPLVVRTPGGGGIGMAAQHSQNLEAWLMSIPGLIIMAPGTAYDAKGLLKSAIRSNNPVLFFENKLLYTTAGPVPEEEYLVPIGKAEVKREGRDVTLVAIGAMVGTALEAADNLGREGIEVEVVDPRTLYPCDWGAIVRSAVKTGYMAVVEGGPLTGGFGAECAARTAESAWRVLRAPVKRVAAQDVPIPYNRSLENAVVPDVERIMDDVRDLLS